MRILSILAAIAVLAFGGSAAVERWIGAWAASQQVPEPRNALPAEAMIDAIAGYRAMAAAVHLSLFE